jgi:hypothetical protein
MWINILQKQCILPLDMLGLDAIAQHSCQHALLIYYAKLILRDIYS